MMTMELPDEEKSKGEAQIALDLETSIYSASDVQRIVANARREGRASGMLTARRAYEIKLRVEQQANITALESARKETEVARREAVTDRLTGLPNRAYLDAQIEHECASAGRNMMPLMVAMIDIDHFKHINDKYGHPAGDEVLRQIAKAATTGRKTDKLCRYGGEEFILMLPQNREEWRIGGYRQSTSPEMIGTELSRHKIEQAASDALEGILHRVRLEISRACIQYEGKKIPVTASIGGVTYIPTGPATGAEIIRQADSNLYVAKHTGRNTVMVSVYAPAPAELCTPEIASRGNGLIYPSAA